MNRMLEGEELDPSGNITTYKIDDSSAEISTSP